MAGRSDVRIAPARRPDLKPILAFTKQTFDAHHARNPKAFPPQVRPKLEEVHRAGISGQSDGQCTYVARDGQSLAGFVLLKQVFGMGMIYDIGVLKDYRRRGMALALMKQAVAHGEASGWSMVYGAVWDGNDPSHDLFRKAGFTPGRPLSPLLKRFFPMQRNLTYSFELFQD